MRKPALSFGPELGWVECALGKTRCVSSFVSWMIILILNFRVLAIVDGKMIRPAPNRPFEGVVDISCEVSPMAGGEYEGGRYVVSYCFCL